MFSVSELKRKLQNIVRVTTIVTPHKNKSLATVRVGVEEESALFPVIGFANSFKRHATPIRRDEQVIVLHPFGNADQGFIFRGLFHKKLKEPKGADNHTEIMVFEDGTRMEYNSKHSLLKIDVKGDTEIICKKLHIKAEKMIIESKNIKLNKKGTIDVTGVLVANGCNLSTHTHSTTCTKTPTTASPCSGRGMTGGGLSNGREQSQVTSEEMESSAQEGDLFAVKCVES